MKSKKKGLRRKSLISREILRKKLKNALSSTGKILLSEKAYWFVLIAGLSIFLIIDWLFLVPISWDVGINLFTDAIFTVFTIVFLMWLIGLRERLQWKSAKENVLGRISKQIGVLFVNLVEIYEHEGFNLRFPPQLGFVTTKPSSNVFAVDVSPAREKGMNIWSFVGKEGFERWREVLLYNVEEFQKIREKGKFLFLRKETKEYLHENAEYLATLFDMKRNFLSDIESKYFKFLSPGIVCCLMEIQDSLRSLSESFAFYTRGSREGKFEEDFFFEVSTSVQKILDEIQKIDRCGVKVYFPHACTEFLRKLFPSGRNGINERRKGQE